MGRAGEMMALARAAPPAGRLAFALALVTLAALAEDWRRALLALLAAAGLLIWLDVSRGASALASLRAGWRLLRWLIWPVLALHAWLTPGELLFPLGESGARWSPTREGLIAGAQLALRLMALYASAMLLARLPGDGFWRGEWLRARWPGLWRRLRLMEGMSMLLRDHALAMRRQFSLRRRWREAGALLAALVEHGWRESAHAADAIWLRWPAATGDGRDAAAGAGAWLWWSAALALWGWMAWSWAG